MIFFVNVFIFLFSFLGGEVCHFSLKVSSAIASPLGCCLLLHPQHLMECLVHVEYTKSVSDDCMNGQNSLLFDRCCVNE